jgi:hypothetical protein
MLAALVALDLLGSRRRLMLPSSSGLIRGGQERAFAVWRSSLMARASP